MRSVDCESTAPEIRSTVPRMLSMTLARSSLPPGSAEKSSSVVRSRSRFCRNVSSRVGRGMIWYSRTVRSSDETCRTSAWVYCVAATPLTTSRSLAADRLRISMAALIVPSSAGKATITNPSRIRPVRERGRKVKRVMVKCREAYVTPYNRSNECSAPVFRADPRRRRQRGRGAGSPVRRPHPGPQQLRKPRVPGGPGGDDAGRREVLSPRTLAGRGDPGGARVRAGTRARRDPRDRPGRPRRSQPVQARGISLRRLSARRWALARTGDQGRSPVDGTLSRAHPPDRPHPHVSPSAAPGLACAWPGHRGLPARFRLDPVAPRGRLRIAGRGRAGPGGAAVRRGPAAAHAAAARRLPPGQRAVDGQGSAFRRSRRLHDRAGRAGPVDAAVGTDRGDARPAG